MSVNVLVIITPYNYNAVSYYIMLYHNKCITFYDIFIYIYIYLYLNYGNDNLQESAGSTGVVVTHLYDDMN